MSELESEAKSVEVKEDEKTIRIGTRRSNLAMWQANHVADALGTAYPSKTIEVLGMQTLGDKDQMKPLNQFGTTGVFTKELDQALLSHRIDVAVHSLKDLPTVLPEGLELSAVLERGMLADALVLPTGHADGLNLATLPPGSRIGTSALRRQAVLNNRFPHLQCLTIRGNVNTRLAKLDRGDYDAIILASVGLTRIGLADRISELLPADDFGHAVGQGALGVVTRLNSVHSPAASALTHTPTLFITGAERSLLKTLAGGCSVPLLVKSTLPAQFPGEITLHGAVLSIDGKVHMPAEHTAMVTTLEDAVALGRTVAEDLVGQGALQLLRADNTPPSV